MRLFGIAAIIALVSSPALACQCDAVPLDELVQSSTLAFVGRAVVLDMAKTPPQMEFGQTTAYKGVRLLHPVISLNHAGGDPTCTADIETGKDYFIVARGSFDSGYSTDYCALAQANSDPVAQQKLMAQFSLGVIAGNGVLSSIDYEMKDLAALRNYVNFLLASMNSELALQMSKRAIEVSQSSWIDVVGMGEALLQLYQPRQALEKFDDVLEVNTDNQDAWRGRYRALAQMNRWSELPAEGTKLSHLVLRDTSVPVDLKNADFSKSWLEHVNAEKRNLTGANFSESRLVHVGFAGAGLSGANFTKARLRAVDFRGVDLSGVSFQGSTLTDVDFIGAKLTGADFSGADLSALDLRGIDLAGAKTDAATKLPAVEQPKLPDTTGAAHTE